MAEYQKRYITSSEVTKIYGISSRMLSQWRQEKVGPPFVRLGERSFRYKVSDLENWLVGNTVITGENRRY